MNISQTKQRGRSSKKKVPDPVPCGFAFTDSYNRRWVLNDRIGPVPSCKVYTAAQSTQNEYNSITPRNDYVVKVDYYENGALFNEIHFYSKVCKETEISNFKKQRKLEYLGISPCVAHGAFAYNDSKYRFLILERYGNNLQQILKKTGSPFRLKTAYTIAVNVLHILEYIHEHGFCHGDVKGENLLLGSKSGTENRIYLVDMGLGLKYLTPDNQHKKEAPDKTLEHNGTLEFTSRDCHRGTPATRRSDMEILGYNLLYWLSLKLPWIGTTDSSIVCDQKTDFMMSLQNSLLTFFHPTSIPFGMLEYFTYVNQLGFTETPDYGYCRRLFISALSKASGEIDGRLDFSVPTTLRAPPNQKLPNLDLASFVLDPNTTPTPEMLAVMDRMNKRLSSKRK